ncbi:NERD domain-containing protein [Phycisphaerales bacterium]|nr:NERD domain-containing protein [Phycisphaerales bacterium]
MPRLIDPPRADFGLLPTPLTAGELEVVDFLDHHLSEEWELYVQPFLNGLRPDVVVLHPRLGIAVFEVKDWDFNALHYFVEDGRFWASGRFGPRFRPEDPVEKVRLYQKEIFELYCPRLDQKSGIAAITAGVILTRATRDQVKDNLELIRDRLESDRHPDREPYLVIATREDLDEENISKMIPSTGFRSSKLMNPTIAEDLRGWLREPALSRDQREPLQLDAWQRQLVSSRTETGYRRIRGPAGSGKSLVLAARASELAASGLNVLVVSFNITLLNYLRDLAVRHVASRRGIRQQVCFLNFHAWGKRVCGTTGNGKVYEQIWESQGLAGVMKDGLAELVSSIYGEPDRPDSDLALPRYDAILVDEGQDFRLSWWKALRRAVVPNGEMVLAADRTQDIYSTASAWTDSAMNQAGFRGPWSEMKVSYRLPPKGVELARSFASSFLGDQAILPEPDPQLGLSDLFPAGFRWVQIDETVDSIEVFMTELRRMFISMDEGRANADVTIITGKDVGRDLVGALTRQNVNVLHTFGKITDADSSTNSPGVEAWRSERRQKIGFFQGDARVKATTLHSFKGWESRHLLIFLPEVKTQEHLTLVYMALTRIKRDPSGSQITVICGSPQLREYGKSWPDYVEGPDPIG